MAVVVGTVVGREHEVHCLALGVDAACHAILVVFKFYAGPLGGFLCVLAGGLAWEAGDHGKYCSK